MYNKIDHYKLAYEWLLELDEGQHLRVLSKILGVSTRTVADWRKNGRRDRSQGSRKSMWSTNRYLLYDQGKLKKIEYMINDGASHAEICRTLRVSHETVERYFPGSAWDRSRVIEHLTAIRKADKIERLNWQLTNYRHVDSNRS